MLFHISDEPEEKDLETYQQNKELISDLIGGLPVIDAPVRPEFFMTGAWSSILWRPPTISSLFWSGRFPAFGPITAAPKMWMWATGL